jgi:hypothetical protein
LATYTEFYCNASTGSNMNGGSDTATSPTYTATNGGWNSGTGVFTPTSGNPSLTVTVGQFASVFTDGATTPVFIARVTAVSSTTVTVSTTVKSGTAPTTAGTGISINVGGVWKGPNGAVAFPFGFVTSALTDSSSNVPRFNFKNNASYVITAAMTHANAGPMKFQGYTTTVADGGRAVIDGGTSGASYTLLTLSNLSIVFEDFEFKNNGATGTATGVSYASARATWRRCVFHDLRGYGFAASSSGIRLVECEAYNCNQGGLTNGAGFYAQSICCTFLRCISHDNSGSTTHGFFAGGVNQPTNYIGCIADSNGGSGFYASQSSILMTECDSYNNGSHGLYIVPSAASCFTAYAENSNFVKNGGWGIEFDSVAKEGWIVNCGFGTGTQANASGTIDTANSFGTVVSGTVTYASGVTPWVDPANGDFRINLSTAQGTGRGNFFQTQSGYAGALSYPDVGAGQATAPTTGGARVIAGAPILM